MSTAHDTPPPPDVANPRSGAAPRWRVLMFVLLVLSLLAAIALDAADVRRNGRNNNLVRTAFALARRWGPFMLAAILVAIPVFRTNVARALDRLRDPTPRARRIATIAIILLATPYLYVTAVGQRRDLAAREQDESMYLIQAHMLARGHLWMPQHPCADFFETFHVIVRPVYAAMYFPGTALAYVPSIWAKLPSWSMSLLIAGLCVGMTYRVLAELSDGVAGAMAALLLVATMYFRHLSTMVMSHTLLMLLALGMTWAYLKWRRRHELKYATLCGAFAGWAAITRPLDALCYAVPLVIAIAWDLRRGAGSGFTEGFREGSGFRVQGSANTVGRTFLSAQKRPSEHQSPSASALSTQHSALTTALVALLAALPFLSLQLILDYGVTGHLLQTPVTAYHQHYWPHMQLGYAGDTANYRPPTALPQFHQYYHNYVVPSFATYAATNPLQLIFSFRLPLLLAIGFPSALLAALIALAPFSTRRAPQWALILALPCFLLAYASFMFFRKQYSVPFLPPLFAAAILGGRAIELAWPGRRDAWNAFLALSVLGLCVASLPQFNPAVSDQPIPTPILSKFNAELAKVRLKPAIVLVRHHPGPDDSWSQEPVYNHHTDHPDHAKILRAHDLGRRNVELFRYYAQHQPTRHVYRFDKADGTMRYLGKVSDLAASN